MFIQYRLKKLNRWKQFPVFDICGHTFSTELRKRKPQQIGKKNRIWCKIVWLWYHFVWILVEKAIGIEVFTQYPTKMYSDYHAMQADTGNRNEKRHSVAYILIEEENTMHSIENKTFKVSFSNQWEEFLPWTSKTLSW